uniref:Uncharacterized protein n=1 Tax=Arundo donax TaxID=35708 RepID=A0A0A9HFD8_ARUDO
MESKPDNKYIKLVSTSASNVGEDMMPTSPAYRIMTYWQSCQAVFNA